MEYRLAYQNEGLEDNVLQFAVAGLKNTSRYLNTFFLFENLTTQSGGVQKSNLWFVFARLRFEKYPEKCVVLVNNALFLYVSSLKPMSICHFRPYFFQNHETYFKRNIKNQIIKTAEYWTAHKKTLSCVVTILILFFPAEGALLPKQK